MPRLGLGSIDLSSVGGTGQDVVTTIDDFFFESNASGEVNPILTTSRTNLVTYSEDFGNAFWNVSIEISKDLNSIAAPDSTLTADKIKGTTVSSRHYIGRSALVNASKTASFSVFAKAGELRYLQIASFNTVNQHANFDLLTGTIGNIGSDFANVKMDSLANDWYRITLTSVGKYNGFYLFLVSGLTAGWAETWSMSNDTDGLFLWGAQLEEDGFASAYIPTSGSTVTVSTTLNDTSEVWDFDSTDIMLEADPEDEGFWEEGSNLVLNHDYADLGSELVTNGGFATETDWTFANVGFSPGAIAFNDSNDNVFQNFADTVGETYKLTITKTGGGVFRLRTGFSGSDATKVDIPESGVVYFTATSNTNRIQIYGDASGASLTLNSVSVKQVDPNDRWSLTNTTISDGVLNFPDNSSAAKFAIHSNTSMMDIGSTYEITLTVNKTAGGVLKVLSGTGGSVLTPDVSISSSGTHTFIATNNTNGGALFLYTTSGENFQGTVDNVTVREYAVQPKDI